MSADKQRDDFKRALGKRLFKRRKRAGMTQAELARASEIKECSIRNYEQAKNDMPAYALYRISAALGCKMEDLTGVW
ncbi:MAG: helix-turn-helix transcriptional regulator [Eggerthellaceae bacterium]|nr:helix-turn-helix transcriptional regulator [Eggerthellaceae bacterium]